MKVILTVISLIIIFYSFLIVEGLFNNSINSNNRTVYWIIYWNKIELDWNPSKRLEARLNAWYDLYNKWLISKIIVSGGIWIEWFDEAKIMWEYLWKKGVDIGDMLIDSDWFTTRETSENSYEILWKDILVVWISQWYHIARVKLSLKKSWFKNIYWYAPKYFEMRDVYSILREGPAYIKYLF